jgi:hypothetical protein
MNSGSLKWDIEKIKSHNLFMKGHFPELLDWIKDFFEKKHNFSVDILLKINGFVSNIRKV